MFSSLQSSARDKPDRVADARNQSPKGNDSYETDEHYDQDPEDVAHRVPTRATSLAYPSAACPRCITISLDVGMSIGPSARHRHSLLPHTIRPHSRSNTSGFVAGVASQSPLWGPWWEVLGESTVDVPEARAFVDWDLREGSAA